MGGLVAHIERQLLFQVRGMTKRRNRATQGANEFKHFVARGAYGERKEWAVSG